MKDQRELLTFAEMGELLGVTPTCVYCWATKGVTKANPDTRGERVKLTYIMGEKYLSTNLHWVREFMGRANWITAAVWYRYRDKVAKTKHWVK